MEFLLLLLSTSPASESLRHSIMIVHLGFAIVLPSFSYFHIPFWNLRHLLLDGSIPLSMLQGLHLQLYEHHHTVHNLKGPQTHSLHELTLEATCHQGSSLIGPCAYALQDTLSYTATESEQN